MRARHVRDLTEHVRRWKACPPKPGLTGHQQHQIDLIESQSKAATGAAGLSTTPTSHPFWRISRSERSMFCRLDVDRDQIRAGIGETSDQRASTGSDQMGSILSFVQGLIRLGAPSGRSYQVRR